MFNPLIVEGLCGVYIGGLAVIKKNEKKTGVGVLLKSAQRQENERILTHYFPYIIFYRFLSFF